MKTVYRFPSSLPQNDLAYAGEWTVRPQKIVAGRAARLRLHFHARHVYLVLGGTGDVGVLVNGKPVKAVRVHGFSRLYTLLSYPQTRTPCSSSASRPGSRATRSRSAESRSAALAAHREGQTTLDGAGGEARRPLLAAGRAGGQLRPRSLGSRCWWRCATCRTTRPLPRMTTCSAGP